MSNQKFGTYRILKDNKLIIEHYSGFFELIDSFYIKKIEISDPEYNPNFNMIIDFRKAKISVNSKDVNSYIDFFKSQPKMHGNRKTAFLIDSPKEAAITTLYSNHVSTLSYIGKVFSTIEAAVKWLRIDNLDKHFIENTIEALKTPENNIF